MTINVKAYGAVGDGATDDRAAIQAAIDAASLALDEVWFPPGTFIVTQSSGHAYCLNIPAHAQLRGTGAGSSILKQVASIAASVSLLNVQGDDVAIRDLALDGNKSAQSANLFRAGIFVQSSARLTVANLLSQNFTGDGFKLSSSVTDVLLVDCVATDNGHDGIFISPTAGTVDGVRIIGCDFTGNGVRQIESEPFVLTANVVIANCRIDANGVSTDYALVAGGTGGFRASAWSISDCTVNGPIEVLYVDGLSIVGCHGVNPTTTPSVVFSGRSTEVQICDNNFYMTQSTVDSVAVISVIGSGTGTGSESITIANNRLDAKNRAKAFAIRAEGCISIAIVDNVLDGPGMSAPAWAGISVRATNTTGAEDFRSCFVRGNTIKNWGQIGVTVTGNTLSGSSALLHVLDVSHNVFDDTAGTMIYGMSLTDANNPVQQATIIGNQCTGGVTTAIHAFPSCPMLVGGTRLASGVYSVVNAQLGTFVENIGATAYRRDGGANTTLYVKESGSGTSTGWVAK